MRVSQTESRAELIGTNNIGLIEEEKKEQNQEIKEEAKNIDEEIKEQEREDIIENGGDVEFPQRYDENSDEEAND